MGRLARLPRARPRVVGDGAVYGLRGMTPAPWAQAFALMADHGQCGACQIVVEGMQNVPPGGVDQMLQWEAVAQCLNAIADAHATRH